MDEVVLDGKSYIPSKRAAAEFGYTQDYVGQLCRGGSIDARRVSGQWYIFPDSLRAYKEKADTFKPEPPKYQPDPNVEATLQVDGKEFVSAALAAKITEYNQDYVGQLARAGKIPSKQIGNRWYIDKAAILTHKKEKDALLRAVQAESVGLKRPDPNEIAKYNAPLPITKPEVKLMTYQTDDKPLFPEISARIADIELKAEPHDETALPPVVGRSMIPIKIVEPKVNEPVLEESAPEYSLVVPKRSPVRVVSIPEKTIFQRLFPTMAFSLVLMAAVGLGVYKRDLVYATVFGNAETQSASAASGAVPLETLMHRLLTKEIVYVRAN